MGFGKLIFLTGKLSLSVGTYGGFYGFSRYQLAEGDVVEWRYTCDLGKDVGCDWMSE